MRLQLLNKKHSIAILLALFFCLFGRIDAQPLAVNETGTMDRVQLVAQQISLLKDRLKQGKHELQDLQQQHDQFISQLTIEKTSKFCS